MNIQDYNLDIFVESSEKIFETELPLIVPPYLPDNNVLTSKEYVLTKLFEYLSSFYKMVKDARREANIEKLLEFPKPFTKDNYIELLKKVPYENRSVVTTWVGKIKKAYSLLDNWDISIMTVVLTHHMPIPDPLSTINYYIPMSEQEKKKEEETGKGKGFVSLLSSSPSLTRTWGVTSHPAIYFTAKTSATALIHWIEKHKHIIEHFNKNLEKESKLSSKLAIRTLRIGEAVLITSWGNIKRWKDIARTYDEWDNKLVEEGEEGHYWEDRGVPTPEEFRQAFQSYYSVMQKLESGISESS